MNEYGPPSDEHSNDSIPFSEWLEQTAESRGVSREEVLEQLISSYWTLNEMSEMIGGSEEADEDDELFSQPVSQSFVPVTRSDFEEFEADVEGRIDDLAERTDALEAEVDASEGVSAADVQRRVEDEFATIRKILEHLIDATEANEADLASLEDRLGEDVSEFQEEYSRVVHLKQQAMSLGIDSADCDYCGTTVDLSMLLSPQCPNCGRAFIDIEPRKTVLGFGLGNNALKTEPPSARSGNGEDDARTDHDGSEDGPSKIGGFTWGSDD